MKNKIATLTIGASLVAPHAMAATEITKVERIQVIGSRIALRTATDSAVPVDIITAEQLESTGM